MQGITHPDLAEALEPKPEDLIPSSACVPPDKSVANMP